MVDLKHYRGLCTWRRRNGKRAGGITKVELARRLEVSVRTVSRWEAEPDKQPKNIKETLFDDFMAHEEPLTPYKKRGGSK